MQNFDTEVNWQITDGYTDIQMGGQNSENNTPPWYTLYALGIRQLTSTMTETIKTWQNNSLPLLCYGQVTQ